MLSTLVAAVVAAAVSTPSPAFDAGRSAIVAPTIIEDPDWVRTPTIEELVANFPADAVQNGASGEALIECSVESHGRLTGCFVLVERGGDYGFGKATVQLAQHFQMAPRSLSGQPTDGGVIRLPMVWKLN